MAAVDFTISVLGGKISTIPISSRPTMNDKCDIEEIVNTEPVVEEGKKAIVLFLRS